AWDVAPLLRDRLLPSPEGLIRPLARFVPDLLEEEAHPARLDGLERDPVDAGSPVVLLGQRVGFGERLPLADVDVQAPETPGRFGLRLDVDPPPQVLQIDGRLSHLAPASRVGEGFANRRAPSLRGHYPASPLLPAPPPPSGLRPPPRGRRSDGLPGSAAFAAGRGGLRQLLDVPWSPCRRSPPAGAGRRVSRAAAVRSAFALRLRARPPGPLNFGATSAFTR